MRIELKPCPFCGGRAEFVGGDYGDGHTAYWVECKVCGTTDPLPNLSYSMEEVAAAWNKRAEPHTCETCYYYQTVYDRNRPTDRRACFGEHLRVAVGGLDWDEEAEAWADMAPDDSCSRWTAKKICRTIGANGEQVDACSQD